MSSGCNYSNCTNLFLTLGRTKQMCEGFGPQLIMLSRSILFFIIMHLSTNLIFFLCLTKYLSFLHYLFHLLIPLLMCSNTSSQFLSCNCCDTFWVCCHFYFYYLPFLGHFFILKSYKAQGFKSFD